MHHSTHILAPRLLFHLLRLSAATALCCAVGATPALSQTSSDVMVSSAEVEYVVAGLTVTGRAPLLAATATLPFSSSVTSREPWAGMARARAPWEMPVRSRDAARRRNTLVGAAIGVVVGAGATALLLHTGGSTARCDRNANQDALPLRSCVGFVALGGVVGGGVGAGIGAMIPSR